MKSIVLTIIALSATVAFASRPTPKGDTMAQVVAVMEQAKIAESILSVTRLDDLHYILETKSANEEFCRARGYYVTLESRHPNTAAPTYSVEFDGERRACGWEE